MKIAYSSENSATLECVGNYLRRYYDELHIPAEICLFQTPEAMLDSMQQNVYALMILNMEYHEDSGIELCYRMRRVQPNVPVVLMRFREDGKVECIFNNPTLFVMDGLRKECFEPLLDAVRGLVYAKKECSLLVNTVQNLDRTIPIVEIIYVEAMRHRVFLHLTTGEVIELPGPIKTLGDKLSAYSEFLFPHRSFIVNAFYVSCITSTDLYLRTPAITIPIARGKLNAVKQAYDSYFRAFGREMNLQVPPGSLPEE